jgi:hypothetical protein
MASRLHIGDPVVVPLLTKMKLRREVLLDIASKTAGERANVEPTEPPPVIGFETWRWATRFLREEKAVQDDGWTICEQDQVSGIRNAALRIKLIACTTDENTGNPNRRPKNVTEKGPAQCRLIARNWGQIDLFGPAKEEPRDEIWYYCLHASEKCISLEISRPDSVVSGMIANFSDRIILAQPGDIPGIRRIVVPEDFADVPKPQVSRKA